MSPQSDFLTTLPDRAVISMTGPDARAFLTRVISNGPDGAAPGRAQFASLLTPQGKVLADLIFFDDGDSGLLVDLPASEAKALLKRFTLYRLRAKAEIALRDDLAVAAARGEGEAELTTIALAAAPDPRSPELGLRAIVPAGGPVESEGYHSARIAAGVPEFGADYGASEVFSTDVNHDLMDGIDYKKGCFVGQEVASRMRRKGGVRKRTVRLVISNDVETGAPVQAGDTPVGAVTSASGANTLALVRIDRAEKAMAGGGGLSINGAQAQLLDDFGALSPAG
ncbi:MAG: folate-binding protein [Pseudomonadota bacterium]